MVHFTQRSSFSEGQIGRSQHADFRTPEYASFDETTDFKWEATRGIGYSFGYNRNEGPENYLSVEELVRSFVDIVSKNGNLLLNVGPMADGTIPELQRERLLGLGQWLAVNGEAIFGTRPWVRAEGRTTEGIGVRFTQSGEDLYAILMDAPRETPVVIEGLQAAENSTVALLGRDEPLAWEQRGEMLVVALPGDLSPSPAYALKITPVPQSAGLLAAGHASLSTGSKLSDLLQDEAGKAVLERHLGEMLDDPRMEMAMGFSLKQIAPFAPSVLTQEVLDKIDRDLADI